MAGRQSTAGDAGRSECAYPAQTGTVGGGDDPDVERERQHAVRGLGEEQAVWLHRHIDEATRRCSCTGDESDR